MKIAVTGNGAKDRPVIVEDCVWTPLAFHTEDWAYIDEDPNPFIEDWIKLYKI